MPIQQRHIDRLKQIILEENGEKLSNEEAWELARRVYGLFRLLVLGNLDGDDEK